MILKHIFLYLKPDEFPRQYRSEFAFRTRYVCNYLQREVLRPLKFRTDGYSRLAIQAQHDPDPRCRVVPENALDIPIAFDQVEHDALRGDESHEFYISMLVEALDKASQQHDIPHTELMNGIAAFRRGGYRNDWTHQKKMLKGLGVQASLLCSLDQEAFRLRLRLERQHEIVFEREILVTKPDEIIYTHEFKDVITEDGRIIVRNGYGNTVLAVDAATLEIVG